MRKAPELNYAKLQARWFHQRLFKFNYFIYCDPPAAIGISTKSKEEIYPLFNEEIKSKRSK